MTTRLSSDSVGASKLDRRVAVAPTMDWTGVGRRAHVIDQRRGRERECIGRAERMALQELQMSLLAPLPL